jgi:prepilin-type N-terminal cleavage/methylation domain-containing protein/prepilin-type processing-associated H-X9-DG protein
MALSTTSLSRASVKQGCNGRGFTLIELLVVISIIAVLVSLILPAMKGARDTAMAVQCSANLRQIGQGFQIYADAYRDYIPGSTQTRGGSYIDALGNADAIGPASQWTHYSGFSTYPNTKNWRVFWDPAEKPFHSPQDPNTMYTNSVVWHTRAQDLSYASSYAMNWTVSHYLYGKPRKGWNKGPETSHWWNVSNSNAFNPMQMTTPSTAGIMADGQAYNLYFLDEIDSYGPGSPTQYSTAMHAFRHPNETANVMYMDGHVATSKHKSQSGARIWRYLWANAPE